MKQYLLLLGLLFGGHMFGQQTDTINIDLGAPSSELPWNSITNSANGITTNLVTMRGQATDISISVTDAFNGTNNTGTTNPNATLNIPSSASEDSFFGNTVEFADKTEPEAAVLLSGLDPEISYNLQVFASRLADDNRETQYQVRGLFDTLMFLQVADNVSDFVEVKKMHPTSAGTIEIKASPGPGNDNSFGFYYLGALRLAYEFEEEVVDSNLVLVHPRGGEYWQPGNEPEIRWKSQAITEVLLEYSTDNGTSWRDIATVSAFTQSHKWKVPFTPSKECLVRISGADLQDQSGEQFTIAREDSLSCHIVVLGSSTAAGTGPSVLDSAWVWRYRDELFQNDTRFSVTNLARGGYSTFNILPDGTVIPPTISQVIDSQRNISKALSLNPDAVIINLPSNDAANAYPVELQLENYEKILDEVKAIELPYWICTPQPRNFSEDKISIQKEMRDSTIQIFGEFAIDFWTDIATETGTVNPIYNSGDGVHLNDAGHAILLGRVLEKEIDKFLLGTKSTSTTDDKFQDKWTIHPNPARDHIHITNVSPPFDYIIYSMEGELLQKQQDCNMTRISLAEPGLQILTVTQGDRRQVFLVWRL